MQLNSPTFKASQIARVLETWAPPVYAESYDNVGLLVGLPDQEITSVLVTLDMTEEVLDEARALGCNMVVAHHPIWFTPRKKLNGEDYVSRTIMQAVKHDIALYACHTNLDAVADGVNAMIGKKLGVTEMRSLSPKKDVQIAVVAFVEAALGKALEEALRSMLAGPVHVSADGGQARVEISIHSPLKASVLQEINRICPGAQYHTFALQEPFRQAGSGMIGELAEPMTKAEFLAHVKKQFGCGGIRYADADLEKIQRVAWCGGSGSFLTGAAMAAKAHALVTADITYHKFFDSEGKMMLLDIGHFESEQYTSELIAHYLLEKFPSFAVRLSKVITNPVKYY